MSTVTFVAKAPWVWLALLALAWAVGTTLLWPSPLGFAFIALAAITFVACAAGRLALASYVAGKPVAGKPAPAARPVEVEDQRTESQGEAEEAVSEQQVLAQEKEETPLAAVDRLSEEARSQAISALEAGRSAEAQAWRQVVKAAGGVKEVMREVDGRKQQERGQQEQR